MAASTRDVLIRTGATTLAAAADFGNFWRFAGRTFRWLSVTLGSSRMWRLVIPECMEIGVRSLPVILITGSFVGMVLAVQAIEQFRAVGLEEQMGAVVNLSVVRELGPVLAGVMIAGRIGGALTAELGTMNVTEQIDALRSMGTDPIRYLVVPRFLACFLLTPILTLYCDLMGSLGGWFVSVGLSDVDSGPYWEFTRDAVDAFDLVSGLFKSFFFGGAIALISCFKGFHCRPGAEGVGQACTEAFVASFVSILVLDFFLAVFLQAVSNYVYGFRPLL
ncbi:MAG: ABC transporter permease [Phycisphaerae bacterium]|nr:ABC transporter permease [Phycisphaerae bacterium]